MPCYYPLDGWRAKKPSKLGKYPIVFDRKDAQQDEPLKIACGQCIGCRLEKSRQWAMRCVHESSLHPANSFITLTYNEDHLPTNGSLNKRHWQNFMKYLRKEIYPIRIRFFMCGEYGNDQDTTTTKTIGRPHYHALIFGYDFPDKEPYKETDTGELIYTSEQLQSLWPKGFSSIGDLTFDSAAYVARYALKKITGDDAPEHYETVDSATGEIEQLTPEYCQQSNRPGIGADWFKKYRHDCDKGFITFQGEKMPVPKYYNTLYERDHDEEYMFLKREKQEAIDIMDPENTLDRLRVKEKIKLKKLNQLKRAQL